MTPEELLGLSEFTPGQFRRNASGAPLVAHPTDYVKDGSRPKTVIYGRPSSFGKQVENTYNLMKWAERRVALGIVADAEVYESACNLLQHPLDSAEFRELADSVAAAAKRAALATEAAERGTHTHQITEDDDEERDWVKRIEDGENLGIPEEAQRNMLIAWRRMLDDFGLEILAVEAACIHDGYKKAGTLDRIARLTREISFARCEEMVTLAAGTVIVLDVKTGKLTRGNDGLPNYWNSYAVQIATYAGSVQYDTLTDTRSPWPWDINQEWAFIAHLPVLDAIEDRAVCRLVPVDIAAGRQAADLCVAGAAWERNRRVFGVIEHEIVVDSLSPIRDQLQERIDTAKAAGLGEKVLRGLQALEVPTLKQSDDHTAEQLEQINQLLASIEKAHELPFTKPPQRVPMPTAPDVAEAPTTTMSRSAAPEGLTVDDATYDAVQRQYEDLPAEGRSWIGARASEAQRAGCPFHLKDHPTERRFEILRGALAAWDLGDELYREAIYVVTGENFARQPSIWLGACMGVLTIDESRRLAALLADIATETVGVQLSLDGAISLTGDLTAYQAA